MGHEYFTCSACGEQFGSRRVLAEHTHRLHPDAARKNPGTGPNQRKIADM